MENYIVNIKTDDSGLHEIHASTCIYMPEFYNRMQLGWHENCASALSAAINNGYNPINICYYCCNDAVVSRDMV